MIAIDGKALRKALCGARDKGESARTRMMVSACASRLRLTRVSAAADRRTEIDAALEVLGLILLSEISMPAPQPATPARSILP